MVFEKICTNLSVVSPLRYRINDEVGGGIELNYSENLLSHRERRGANFSKDNLRKINMRLQEVYYASFAAESQAGHA